MSSNQIFYRPIPPTIQIHLTLGCNLFCDHCYSSSGPSAKPIKIDEKILREIISDASEMGYKIVSFSGGEPLLYDYIDEILTYSKSKGMTTSLTTNGTLLENKKISKLIGCLDLMAISLDGPPELHNKIRGTTNAFKLLQSGLENVKNKIKFGFIHTLTKESWEHIIWITDFALKHNASLLQIHPLELFGRAETLMSSVSTNDEILARAYLLTTVLSLKYSDVMKIQLDVFHKDRLVSNPELVYASAWDPDPNVMPSDMLSDIVVEPDGIIVPVSYGFSREFGICNVNNKRLKEGWHNYIQQDGYKKFRTLCSQVFKEICIPNDIPLFNWYDIIVNRSYAHDLCLKHS